MPDYTSLKAIQRYYMSKRKETKMPISKDRVEFYVTDRLLNQCENILIDVLGLKPAEIRKISHGGGIRVSCRPSQFGRLIARRAMVLRSDLSAGNNFISELHPELITVRDVDLVDVSGRAFTSRCED